MSSKDIGMGITKLTRAGDFATWQFRMKLHLQEIGVFSIVDGTEAPPRDPNATTTGTEETEEAETTHWKSAGRQVVKDWRDYRTRRDMAISHIMQGIADELAKHYRSRGLLSDPAKLWKKLEEDSKSTAALDVKHLRLQLQGIKLKNCRSVNAYVDQFQQICDKIALAGQTISSGERYFHMMQGLPEDWEHYKGVMASRVPNSENWRELIPLMIAQEAELKSKSGVLYSKGVRE